MTRNEPLAGDALARYTRRLGLQMRIAQRASRGRKGWLDRLALRFLERVSRPKPADDFMRDEIVDAGIGFSVEELETYQRGADPGGGRSTPRG